jgi:HlyD family secretion protein
MSRAALVLCALAGVAGCAADEQPLPVVGTLERDRIEVTAEAWEYLVDLYVTEGDTVEEGQLLMRLDDARARAQVDQARAALTRSQRRLDELVRGPRAEEIEAQRSRLAGAESRLVTDERELSRVADLVERRLQSPSDLDQAHARRDLSKAERDEARVLLAELLEGTTLEELDQARAALAEADATLRERAIGLSRHEVRAPRAGLVDGLPYARGARPAAGAVVAVLLTDDAPYARVYVPEPVRAAIQPGLAAVVKVDGVEQAFAGAVRTVASDATFTPYFALTERDRSRLAYLSEIELTDERARGLPVGLPVTVNFPALTAVE